MRAPISAGALYGYLCTRCDGECAEMVPDGVGDLGQMFRCAEGFGCRAGVECRDCGAIFPGGRTEARRAHWEPFSTSTQEALDRGPMVCAGCIRSLLDDLVEALRGSAGFRA